MIKIFSCVGLPFVFATFIVFFLIFPVKQLFCAVLDYDKYGDSLSRIFISVFLLAFMTILLAVMLVIGFTILRTVKNWPHIYAGQLLNEAMVQEDIRYNFTQERLVLCIVSVVIAVICILTGVIGFIVLETFTLMLAMISTLVLYGIYPPLHYLILRQRCKTDCKITIVSDVIIGAKTIGGVEDSTDYLIFKEYGEWQEHEECYVSLIGKTIEDLRKCRINKVYLAINTKGEAVRLFDADEFRI